MNEPTAVIKSEDTVKTYRLIDDNGRTAAFRISPNKPFSEAPPELKAAVVRTMAATQQRSEASRAQISLLSLLGDRQALTVDEVVEGLFAAAADRYTPAEGVTVALIIRQCLQRRADVNGQAKRFTYNEMLRECEKSHVSMDQFTIDRETLDSSGKPTWTMQSYDTN